MTVEEYIDNLKVIAKNAGAAKTGVEIETEDGYLISIYVTKRQNKSSVICEKSEIRDSHYRK